ncbi:hypothetical protein ABPG73_002192 [Tetrahymena malaccensis]
MNELQFTFVFFFFAQIILQSAQQCLQNGCTQCDKQNNCLSCSSNYFFDQLSKSCIYSQCDSGLYYQSIQNDQNNQNTCVAVCQNKYIANPITNTCDQSVMCSSSIQTQNNIQPQTSIQQSFRISDNVIAVIYQGYVTLISIDYGYAYKTMTFNNNIAIVQALQGQVFIATTDNKIYLWDLLLDSQQLLYQVELNLKINKIILLNNQMVCVIVSDIKQNELALNAIFNLQDKSLSNFNNISFKLKNDTLIYNDILINSINNQPLRVQQIQISQNQLIYSNSINCTQLLLNSNLTLFYDFGNNNNYVLQSNNQNSYFEFISINTNSCQKILTQSQIQSIKHIQISIQLQQFVLLVQQTGSIIVLNQYLTQIQTINVNSTISDFQVISLDQINQSLILLDNQSFLRIYQLNNQNLQLQQSYALLINSSSPYLYPIQIFNPNFPYNTYGVLVQSQSNLQIILKDQINQNILTQVITNYYRPFPQQLGTPVKLLVIDFYQLIVVCYQQGLIGIFDISSGSKAKIFNTLLFQNQTCINIENIQQTQILVQLDKQILLVDIFTGNTLQSFNITGNQISFVGISVNGLYSSLSYNNKFEIYENQNFGLVFQTADSTLISQTNSFIKLNFDLSIIIIRDFSVNLFQIYINNQTFSQINSYKSASQILFTTLFTTQIGQIEQNTYNIDEIAIIDQTSKLTIININFQNFDQIQLNSISQVLDFKRVSNDKDQYFLMLPYQQNNQQLYSLTAIKRANQLKLNSFVVGLIQSFSMVEATKVQFYDGKSYYLVSNYLYLNIINVLMQMIFQIDNTSDQLQSFYYGQTYLFGPSTTNSFQKQPLDSRNLLYNSNYQGQIASFDLVHMRYVRINIDQYLSQNDEIILVFQSSYINKYFVQTIYSLMILDMFDDTLDDQINFKTPSDLIKAQNIDSLNSLVISQPTEIFLRYFDMVNGNKDYKYNNMKLINDWIYSESDSYIYIYGSGLQCLDIQLNLIQVLVNQNLYEFKKCFITQNQLICLLNSPTLLYINKQTGSINYQVQIQGFSSNSILMELDYIYNYVFLAESYLQVFTFSGALFKTIIFQAQGINFLSVEDIYVISHTNTMLLCYDRQTLNLISYYASPSALNIVKAVYIQQFQQVAFICDGSFAGQIFIYGIKDMSIQKISSLFSQNGIGTVVDFAFYIGNTRITYLDEFGNINQYNFFGAYQSQGFTKITDIINRNETPIGMSIDYVDRFMFIYSQNSVYKQSYTLIEDKEEVSVQSQSNIFTVIQTQSSSQQSQFLVLNNNNMVLRYQDYTFIVELIFNEQVLSMRYINISQTLVIAFKNYLQIIQNYQYGQASYIQSTQLKTQKYLFKQFIDDDVFITYDYKMINYDYINMKEIKAVQFMEHNYVTTYYINSNFKLVILGFYNGDILIYNKQNYSTNTLSQIRLLMSNTFKKQINFFVNINPNEVMISSIQGDILQLNMQTSSVVKTFNIQQLLVGQNLPNINLNFFGFDDLQNRIIFNFYGSSKGYVFSLDLNKPTGYISSGNFQNNYLLLSSNFIICRNSGVINIYQRSGPLRLLSSIYSIIFSQTILDIKIVNEQFLIVVSIEVIQIYLIKNGVQTSQTIFIQYLDNPQIVEYSQSLDSNGMLRVLVLTSNGIIEINISTNTYLQSNNQQCSYLVNSSNTRELELKTLMVKPLMIQTQGISNIDLNPSTQYQIDIFLQTQSSLLPLVNNLFLNLQQQYNSSLILSSDQSTQNQLLLTPTTFSSIKQKQSKLINFSLQLSQECQISQDCRQVSFDSSTNEVMWQDISISSINDFRKVRIIFQNLTQVTISNITIQLNSDQSENISNRFLQQTYSNNIDMNQDCLLCFYNVQVINLYQIKIISNTQYLNLNYSMILLNQVNKFQMKNLVITNNSNIQNFFKFTLINQILIDTVKIEQNNSTFLLNSVFNMLSCDYANITNVQFNKNLEVCLLNSTNIYSQINQTIINKNDQIIVNNFTINGNKITSFPLVQLQNSQITLSFLNVTYNSNNIKIISALSLKIQECNFIQNLSQNGGALYIYGLSEKFTLQKTKILDNEAQSSGGGIYFEDNYSQEWQIDFESQISGNTALIGGGIRIVNKLSKIGDPNGYPFISVIQNNKAGIYGNNACSFIKNVLVEDNNESNLNPNEEITNKISQYQFKFFKNSSQVQYGQISLSKFNSGGNLQLKIYLLDEDNRKLTFQKEMISSSAYPNDILDELKYISIFTDLGQNKLLQLTGEIILNYNMYDASQSLNFENTQQCYYLRKMHFLPISKHLKASQSTSFIKIILTYLQFSNLLITQPNFLPIQLNILPDLLGSPNQIAVLSTSCLIPLKVFQQQGKALVYSILNLCTPISLMILSLLLIIQLVFKSRVAKYYIYYTLIFTIYIFFMVDMVQFFILNVTCRKIGSQRYHSIDLLLKCDDPQLKNIIYPLSSTILALWCTIPMIAFLCLYNSRNKLQFCRQRYIFGYFYQEFQQSKYYWEIIRIYLKIFTIIQFTLLKQEYLMSTRVITVALFGAYIRSVTIHKPFQYNFFSKAEIITFQILICKLLLITLSEQIDFASFFLELITYAVDYIVILYIVVMALKLFFEDKNSLLFRYTKLFVYKCLPKSFQNAFKIQRTSFKTYLRWKKIYKNLNKIMLMKSNQFINEKITQICKANNSPKPDSIYQFSQQFTRRLQNIQISNKESDILSSTYFQQKGLSSFLALNQKKDKTTGQKAILSSKYKQQQQNNKNLNENNI